MRSLAMDNYIHLYQSMFSHQAERSGRGSWGKTISSPANSYTVSRREGLDMSELSVDAYVQLTQSINAHQAERSGRGSWGKKIASQPYGLVTMRREGLAGMNHAVFCYMLSAHSLFCNYRGNSEPKSAEGIDMDMIKRQDVYTTQSQGGLGNVVGGWETSETNQRGAHFTLKSHLSSVSEGAPHHRAAFSLISDRMPERVGLVLPYDDGLPILLASLPSKCEVLNSFGSRLVIFSKAWVKYPQRLASMIEQISECEIPPQVDPSVIMLQIAELVYSQEQGWPEDELDEVSAYEYLASTFYGAMMVRLKRAQIEFRPPLKVIETYQHENSLIIATPPTSQTPSEAREMADALVNAIGDRAAIVTPDSHAVETFAKNDWNVTDFGCGTLWTSYSPITPLHLL